MADRSATSPSHSSSTWNSRPSRSAQPVSDRNTAHLPPSSTTTQTPLLNSSSTATSSLSNRRSSIPPSPFTASPANTTSTKPRAAPGTLARPLDPSTIRQEQAADPNKPPRYFKIFLVRVCDSFCPWRYHPAVLELVALLWYWCGASRPFQERPLNKWTMSFARSLHLPPCITPSCHAYSSTSLQQGETAASKDLPQVLHPRSSELVEGALFTAKKHTLVLGQADQVQLQDQIQTIPPSKWASAAVAVTVAPMN